MDQYKQPPNDNNLRPKHKVSDTSSDSSSLVPIGVTIGLAVFSLVLVLAGYGFRLAFGDSLDDVLRHAIVVVPVFVIGIPLWFWLGSLVMNKLFATNIQMRNAFSLGWLTSCVAMLWLMGTYS